MQAERLAQQIKFIVEIDRLKTVLRQTLLTDGSRQENSAEHSWHLAVMALLLAEYADEPVDVLRVVKMVLVHDLVEVDAGDTFCYDTTASLDKAQREERAAARLFALLPAEQGEELRALWEEFEAQQSAEARFATALDRLQPLLHNLQTAGGSWRVHGIRLAQVQARMAPVGRCSARLAAYVEALLQQALAAGYLTA